MIIRLLLSALLLNTLAVCPAQLPEVSRSSLGVDLVNLTQRQRLFGFVLSETEDGVSLLVDRSWLKATYPNEFQGYRQAEQERQADELKKLEQKIETWIKERAEDLRLVSFLREELARLQAVQNGQSPSTFILVKIQKPLVLKVYRQPIERRRLAALAWRHRLPDVTTSSVKSLRMKLVAQGVDVNAGPVDLSDLLPPVAQTETQWDAKVSLVEHALREPLEFQGTGQSLFRSGQRPPLASLFGQMLGGGDSIRRLGAELGLPEFAQDPVEDQRKWWKTATDYADRDGYRGVAIHRITSGNAPQVVIQSTFLAKSSDGNWFLVYDGSTAADANRQDAANAEHLRNDPRIKQVFAAVEQLGLNAESSHLDRALKQGLATQQALNSARDQLEDFVGTYSYRLDAPAVPLQGKN